MALQLLVTLLVVIGRTSDVGGSPSPPPGVAVGVSCRSSRIDGDLLHSVAPARPLEAGLGLWAAPRRLRVARVSLRRFRTRIAYGSNTSATRPTGRYRYKPADALAGDIELNPGPQPATSNPGLQKFTVLSQNVRSIRNKLHTLRAHAGELQSRDVFALTESWLTPDVRDSELQHGWSDHCWFRRDRDGHGGGVACAVRSSLCPTRRADLEPDCELLAVQMGVRSPVIVAVCYRPPDADGDLAKIFEFVGIVRATGRPLILVGDFNLPEIRWPAKQDPVLLRRSARAVQFVDGVGELGLDQSVLGETRGDAVLDLVLSCGGDAVSDVREGTFESDHREIVTSFTVHCPMYIR